jgi:hypothetical protein
MKQSKSQYRFEEIQAEIIARGSVVEALLKELKSRDLRRAGDFPQPAAGIPRRQYNQEEQK